MSKFSTTILTLAAGAAALCVSLPLAAQTTTTLAASTCTTAPTGVTNLSIERALPLTGFSSTLTPNIPANIVASVVSGAQEIRNRLIYNPQAGTVTDTTFLVAVGSPLPTPLSANVGPSTIQSYTLNVTQVFTSCTPVPSVLFVGNVTNASQSPYGSPQGAVGAISIGYTTDNPPKINNVVEDLAGLVVAYSASATGTLTLPAAPVTPPVTSTSGPAIVLNPVPPATGSFQVFSNPFYVDASGSTTPNAPITYSWTSNQAINFLPSNSVPNPNIYFVSGRGDYSITLTATDAKGNASTVTFVTSYLGTF